MADRRRFEPKYALLKLVFQTRTYLHIGEQPCTLCGPVWHF